MNYWSSLLLLFLASTAAGMQPDERQFPLHTPDPVFWAQAPQPNPPPQPSEPEPGPPSIPDEEPECD